MMMMFEPKAGRVWGGTYGSAAALGVFVVLFDHLKRLVDEHDSRGDEAREHDAEQNEMTTVAANA